MKKCPYRILIAVMIFMSAAMNYAYRVYFQISFIAMLDRNETLKEGEKQPDYGPRFKYSHWEEGMIIGAYFYGQTLSSIPGGPIAEQVGPWITMLISALINASLTLIAIFVTSENWVPLFICRFFIGISSGVQYPSMQFLIGTWSPPLEKGKFTACLMGNVFGSVAATAITGALVRWLGWKSSFYGMILVTLIFCTFWFLLISDYPTNSWWCSKEESAYIMASHEGRITHGKVIPPFLKMATSIPYIALIIGQFGSLWGLNLIVTSMPKFMAEVLQFELQKVGFLSALPSLARLIMGFVFGTTTDLLLRKNIIKNKAIVRKGFVLFSHFLPGATLFCYTVVGTSPALAVSFLVIMLGFNGAAVVTMLVNAQDLAPNFAGTLYGIMNCFGSTPGFIIPAINSKILEKGSSWPQWTTIFCIGGCVYISTGIIFIIAGSTKLQPWNEKKMKAEDATPAVT
ncbi:hypothetical protein HHI36_015395 [Cryptolaemus montrouzieri]|uniref:Major facilitator superfamily (MFS) profile domain-containing protein n=1 Tax=Cryptolaemus montrouzieri TaxID=559131 RepID=A0ABD2N5Z8_9CUCU